MLDCSAYVMLKAKSFEFQILFCKNTSREAEIFLHDPGYNVFANSSCPLGGCEWSLFQGLFEGKLRTV